MSAIQIVADAEVLALEAAERIISAAREAVAARGRFSLVLSGGSTPQGLYQRLAAKPFAQQIDWPKAHVFWGDERCVMPDHPDSNYRAAQEVLLRHVPIPPEQVHRMAGEDDPAQAALDYEETLRAYFGSEPPYFDLILMGMGSDGHTLSLFPHSAALDARPDRWVVENLIPSKRTWRITMTADLVNAGRSVIFLVSGMDKAERLQQVVHGSFRPAELPAQLIRPTNGNLTWLVDQAAASALNPRPM